MMKRKVSVTNTGKRMRDRLGSRFNPKETKVLEVNSRQYLTLKAVKDFEVSIINEDDNKSDNDTVDNDDTSTDNGVNQEAETDQDEQQENQGQDIQDLQNEIDNAKIEDVISMVEGGKVEVDEAIAYEMVGKNRSTLIAKLEEIKAGE